MNTEDVARAQQRANAAGKPWAVPHPAYPGEYERGEHFGPHEHTKWCDNPPYLCQRIDPAPAKGASRGKEIRTAWHREQSWLPGFNVNWPDLDDRINAAIAAARRGGLIDGLDWPGPATPAPSAPLARDMTMELERLRDECAERKRIAHAVAAGLEEKASEVSDRYLSTWLSMTALALGSEPIPKDIRERMEQHRREALGEDLSASPGRAGNEREGE